MFCGGRWVNEKMNVKKMINFLVFHRKQVIKKNLCIQADYNHREYNDHRFQNDYYYYRKLNRDFLVDKNIDFV